MILSLKNFSFLHKETRIQSVNRAYKLHCTQLDLSTITDWIEFIQELETISKLLIKIFFLVYGWKSREYSAKRDNKSKYSIDDVDLNWFCQFIFFQYWPYCFWFVEMNLSTRVKSEYQRETLELAPNFPYVFHRRKKYKIKLPIKFYYIIQCQKKHH